MPAVARAESDPTRRLDLLLSPAGQDVLRILSAHSPVSSADELRLSKRLRVKHSAELVAAALGLVELRRRGLAKFAHASEMYFTRSGLEQASSEQAARHRAERFARFERVADLCCGIGGDLLALAQTSAVLAVDVDPV